MQFWSSMLWVEGGFAASGLGRPIRELTLPLELLSPWNCHVVGRRGLCRLRPGAPDQGADSAPGTAVPLELLLWVEGGFAASGLGRPIRELTLPLELLLTSSVRRPLQADGPGQGTGLAAAGCSSIVSVWQSLTSPMSVWQLVVGEWWSRWG